MPNASSTNRREVASKKALITRPAFNQRASSDVDYRQLFEKSSDAILFVNHRCIILQANPACEKLYGYRPDELIGRCGFDLPFIKNAPQYRTLFLQLIKGGKTYPIELEITHKNGEKKVIEVNPSLCRIGGQPGALMMVRDITAHKKWEEQIKKSENTYHGIFEHTGTATIIIEENMLVSYVNSEFERLSGYNKSEIIGQKSWLDFFHEKEIEKMSRFHKLRRTDASLAPRNYEATFIDCEGNEKIIFMTVGMIPETKQSVASLLDITSRKNTEKALQSSKKLFDDLVDNNPDPIYAIDTQHRVIYWNKAMENITGIPAEEVLYTQKHWNAFYGKPTSMIVDLLVEGKTLQQILNIKRYKSFRMSRTREGSITGVKFFNHFNGQRKWLKFYIKPMRDSTGRVIGAIEAISDVTPEKKASESLENRVRELEALYNIAHRQHMGIPLSSFMSRIMKNLVMACDVIESARTRITLDGKTYSTLKKGESFINKIEDNIEIMGKIRGKVELGYIDRIFDKESFDLTHEKKVIHVVVDNISKHVQNRELIDRHKKLVNKSMVGIFIVQDDVFKFANPKFMRILKVKEKDIIHQPCYRWFSSDHLCSGRESHSSYIQMKRKDDKWIHAELYVQVIEHDGKKAILGTMQDITKIKKAQERQQHFNKELKTKIAEKTKDLRLANKRLQSLNQLKDEFIAIASHELRSPLTSARGYLSFLTESEFLKSIDEEYREYLARASHSVQSLNYLVNNILDVSRIEMKKMALDFHPTCIDILSQKVIDNLTFQSQRKNLAIEFKNQLEDKALILMIDPIRMEQVLRNILENAIRHSPEGKKIKFSLSQKKEELLIAIADKGPGIKKSQLKSIFGKFNQANKNLLLHQSGSGLGLFIAREIIKLHGGEIWCESKLKRGAAFKIKLPIQSAAPKIRAK